MHLFLKKKITFYYICCIAFFY